VFAKVTGFSVTHCTCESDSKPPPVRVSVKEGAPTWFESGERPVNSGPGSGAVPVPVTIICEPAAGGLMSVTV
jgi:hypothetical protein